MSKVAVVDIKGSKKGDFDLPKEISEGYVNQDVIHQAVVKYQASLRQGNASTKERTEVSGGGRKPFKQKGTGRARAGSSRSPLWIGGGVTFGPKKRDFGYTIPKKIKIAALRESVKAKIIDEKLICLDSLADDMTKTKQFAQIIKDLNITGKALLVLDESSETIVRVTKNIANLNLVRVQDVNAYDVLRNKNLIITKSAFEKIVERLMK